MGDLGAALLPDEARVLTHCNAGALATAGYGTALGVIRSAAPARQGEGGLRRRDAALLQGARLTAWELLRDGIPTTLIADNMAGYLMARGEINAVVVGADRIAANGDVANKIGTYTVAVLAREHGIPFYVAAPVSTFDLATPTGAEIPIEERPAEEVTHLAGRRVAPEGVAVRNPAFDVTPHRYVTAIVCERGVARPPYAESLRALAGAGPCRNGSARGPRPRHRDLLRRDRGRRRRGRAARPLERRLQPGRRPRALRRRRAGARLAPPPREHRAR